MQATALQNKLALSVVLVVCALALPRWTVSQIVTPATINLTGVGNIRFIEPLPGAQGRLLIAGVFNTVDGQSREVLACLCLDGSLDTTWDAHIQSLAPVQAGRLGARRQGKKRLNLTAPAEVAAITALRVAGTNVFVGGTFTNIGGAPLVNLARLSAANGQAAADWNPAFTGTVAALAVDDQWLYVAGCFSNI